MLYLMQNHYLQELGIDQTLHICVSEIQSVKGSAPTTVLRPASQPVTHDSNFGVP